jgi:magnesium chelatase family protein
MQRNTQAAVEQLDPRTLEGVLLIGELSLDGSLRAVTGVLPRLDGAERRGIATAIVPRGNSAEAGLARGVKVLVADSLEQVVQHLRGQLTLPAAPRTKFVPATSSASGDLSEVRGQATARRALEVAAAGGHNLLLL